MILLFVFMLGTVFGSFANVVILRSKSGESLWNRSHCPVCGHTIAFYDLIPLVSYLFLLGQCRQCHREISWQYPFVEGLCGVIYVLLFEFWGLRNEFIYYGGLSVWLVIIAFGDYRFHEIDDWHIATALVWVIGGSAAIDKLGSTFAGGVAGLVIASAIYMFSRWQYGESAFGTGDVTLSVLVGAIAGWAYVYPTYCLALVYHIIAAVVLGVCKKNATTFHRVSLPFAPALILASCTYPLLLNYMRGDVFL